jgi:flagellar M-ring protein FliF
VKPNATALRDLWKNLGPKGQLAIVGSALLVIVTFFFLYRTAAKPSYAALLTGLDPAETSQIGDALDAGGIHWRLANGGTEVDVSPSQESAARVALAKKNLPNGGHVGFELFDKQSFGTTDFQQKVEYQRALEGEISRTIESIQGVQGADVQLVLPDDSLFTDQSAKASAAVLVKGGSSLDGPTIAGIAHLVSSSVKQLSTADVTITDEQGNLLWPRGDGAGGDDGALTKLEAQQRYDAQLSSQITALLTQTLGLNKAQVRVHADLNLDQSTVDKVTFAKKGTPLTTKTDLEGLKAKGAATTPGSSSSPSTVPTYGATTGGAKSSNYTHQITETDYGVNKTVEHQIVAPGSVNRLDVALLVDSSVPAKQVTALRQSVAALAGLDTKRGDTLAVSSIAFAKQPAPPAAKKSPIPTGALGPLKWIALLLGGLIFFFLIRRNLVRREKNATTVEPTWLREIEQAVPIAELEAATAARTPIANGRADALREQVEEIARKQPETLALQVGQWMKKS